MSALPTIHTDPAGFPTWLASRAGAYLALDTETTGLQIYSADHKLRLVQIGDRGTAWVLRAGRDDQLIRAALDGHTRWIAHNSVYDALVLERHGYADSDLLLRRTLDTRILSHLVDSRGRAEGGVGHGLKDLAVHYLGAEPGGRFDKRFLTCDLDDPEFVHYAGLDVIWTARLLDVLVPLVRKHDRLERLAKFEHEVQRVCAGMVRRGVLVDVPYTESAVAYYAGERDRNEQTAADLGVGNVNSTREIADALIGYGVALTERTDSGLWKVDAKVLAGIGGDGPEGRLAAAVTGAKNAGHFSKAYLEAFLALRDGQDRLHPTIRSLAAVTARMSISDPPLQQLPAKEWRIRRSLIADPGNVFVSVDFKAVELRVLAAVAGVRRMKEAIVAGTDLHDVTSASIYGPDFSPAQRKVAKIVGLAKSYGGGAKTIARQTGIPLADVETVLRGYSRAYPEIGRYGRRLQSEALGHGCVVVTPTGRRLQLDRDRLYKGTAYVCQSAARDLLAQALLNVDAAGLGHTLVLPVHDELLVQCPPSDARDVSHAIAECMRTEMLGVAIDVDEELIGPTWGKENHGHGA